MISSKLIKVKVFSYLRKNVRQISDIPDDNKNNFNQKQFQQFKKTLKNLNISCKDGYTSIQTECKVCGRFNTKPSAFINKTTGFFLCPTCDYNQPLCNVLKFYEADAKNNNLKKNITGLGSLDTFKEYFNPSWNECQTPPQDLYNRLKIPGLDSSLLNDLNVKYNSKDDKLHFPLRNAAGKVVGEKIFHLNEMEEETLPLEICSGVLMTSNLKTTKAILVLNILDFLALISQKIDNLTIVCLPYGLKSLPLQCLPVLETFKELVLWFDFDLSGWDVDRHFSRKLDEKRCLFIRPTDTQLTPYKALRKRLNLKHVIYKAEPILHKSITTFSSLKQDILSELQNIEKVNGVKWKRYPILNRLLKGHRKGELTILTGPTGCGKTTFMSEYSLDLALQGVSTLWGSFEIRNSRLASTLLRQYVGYSLEDKLNEFDYWSSEFEKYPIYFMTFHGQQNIKIVMEAIDHAQYVHDIHHVIIDNVQFMMGVSAIGRTDKFWEQDAIIGAFRTFATTRNVHVTLVMHPRKERDSEDLTTSSIFGSAKATQEADNVLIIQDRRLTSVRGKKFLQIAKNRYSGDLGIMPMDFDKDSLSYARKKKETEPKPP